MRGRTLVAVMVSRALGGGLGGGVGAFLEHLAVVELDLAGKPCLLAAADDLAAGDRCARFLFFFIRKA